MLFTLNSQMPHYGIPEVIREVSALTDSSGSQRRCYRETDRDMCSILYLACSCSSFPASYCNLEQYRGDVSDGDCIHVVAESNGYSI